MQKPADATLVLAHNLDRLMRARDWTLVEVAKRSGGKVSKSAVGNIRNYRGTGDKHATTETVQALADVFGLQAWQMLCPEGELPQPEPLDTTLLASTIRAAAEAFRTRGTLPDDTHLASAAAYLYRRVREGSSLKRAATSVAERLEYMGMNLAGLQDGPSKGERPRGSSGKGVAGKRKTRTR